jgi:Putative lipase essential for disintegration of autophagic bodies inside the vacuole
MSLLENPSSGLAGSIHGQNPHVVDRELAQLLASTYTVAAQRRDPAIAAQPLPAGWHALDGNELLRAGIHPADLSDAKSGFDAALYRNEQGLVVLAFNGTDQGRDWRSNLRQGLGLTDVQYDQAIALTSKAQQAFGQDLVLSGHSLGGGLAATAGMVSNIPTVTFNAAGVHDATLERYDRDPEVLKQQAQQGLVRSYEVRNELLTYLQEDSLLTRWVMPDAPGHRIELPDPDPKGFFERMVPGVCSSTGSTCMASMRCCRHSNSLTWTSVRGRPRRRVASSNCCWMPHAVCPPSAPRSACMTTAVSSIPPAMSLPMPARMGCSASTT